MRAVSGFGLDLKGGRCRLMGALVLCVGLGLGAACDRAPAAPAADPSAASKPSAGSAPSAPVAPDPADITASLTEAQRAFDQQRWDDTLAILNALLERHPEQADALALLKRAQDEARYALRLQEALDFFYAERYDDAELKLGSIPAASFYEGQKQETITWIRHAQAFPPHIQRKADDMTMRRVLIGPAPRGSSDEDVTFAVALCRKTLPDATCKPQDFAAEQPQRTVYVNTVYIDEAEVSGAQYKRCVDASACAPIDWAFCTSGAAEQSVMSVPNLPQVCVTWLQAKTYCEWVGGRLPFEAEWEKAARGPAQTRFPWGDLWNPRRANWNDSKDNDIDTFPKLAPTRSLEPNGFGLYHMAGNAIEWTHDAFSPTYYKQDPPPGEDLFLDPEGPPPSDPPAITDRVIKGGSFESPPLNLRAAARTSMRENTRSRSVGFRCALRAD